MDYFQISEIGKTFIDPQGYEIKLYTFDLNNIGTFESENGFAYYKRDEVYLKNY